MRRATFQGKSYFLLGETDGTLCTELEFRSGVESFACITPSGDVMRHLEVIGHVDDVILGDAITMPPFHFPPSRN